MQFFPVTDFVAFEQDLETDIERFNSKNIKWHIEEYNGQYRLWRELLEEEKSLEAYQGTRYIPFTQWVKQRGQVPPLMGIICKKSD